MNVLSVYSSYVALASNPSGKMRTAVVVQSMVRLALHPWAGPISSETMVQRDGRGFASYQRAKFLSRSSFGQWKANPGGDNVLRHASHTPQPSRRIAGGSGKNAGIPKFVDHLALDGPINIGKGTVQSPIINGPIQYFRRPVQPFKGGNDQ